MAVRFNAAADRLLRTSDLLNYNSTYSWSLWIYIVSTVNPGTVLSLNDNSTDNGDVLRLTGTGLTLTLRVEVGAAQTSVDGSTLSTGQWYHIVVVRESVTSLNLYLNESLDITNTRNVTGRAAASRMEVGAETSGNSRRADMRVAYQKAWSNSFVLSEVANEGQAIRPLHKLESLYGFWPCLPGATERAKDYSGNGRNWTEGGTLTDEEADRLRWGGSYYFVNHQGLPPADPGQPIQIRATTIPGMRQWQPQRIGR